MCLTRPLKKELPAKGICYKVFGNIRDNLAAPCYNYIFSGINIKDKADSEDVVNFGRSHEQYTSGFHSFIYLEDALRFRGSGSRLTVYKCEYEEVLAVGTQIGGDVNGLWESEVIVSRYITPLELIKEQVCA